MFFPVNRRLQKYTKKRDWQSSPAVIIRFLTKTIINQQQNSFISESTSVAFAFCTVCDNKKCIRSLICKCKFNHPLLTHNRTLLNNIA